MAISVFRRIFNFLLLPKRLRKALALNEEGLSLIKQSRRDDAITTFDRAVELAGQCPPDWLEILAAAHAEADDFAEAVRWQTQAIAAAADKERSKHVTRLERC